MDGMKNISKAEVLTLRDQVAYQSGQVVSRTLAQNEHVSVTLFSFDKGEEISTHESGGDAMVTCLDGVGRDHDRRRRAHPARGRIHRHARASPARGVRSGAVQDAARRGVLIFLFAEKVRKQSVFAPLPQGGALSRRMLLCVA